MYSDISDGFWKIPKEKAPLEYVVDGYQWIRTTERLQLRIRGIRCMDVERVKKWFTNRRRSARLESAKAKVEKVTGSRRIIDCISRKTLHDGGWFTIPASLSIAVSRPRSYEVYRMSGTGTCLPGGDGGEVNNCEDFNREVGFAGEAGD
ncbi:hypothetical protein BDP27DRAFT_1359742 [Rhodocollybia butyracea]|uniref:Uncharacterized protein n=1 Tax=Rhodocollybia butyracea TaxID=206335 RepID=A0A9P5UCK5_9AGAR|nr:hypothetical protein BDP27DRAFT_1359742 [Rhodocollybia butyracea]